MAGTAPSSSDCLAYWALEDLTDETGTYSLTNNGATSGSTGIVDDCYSFDGINDFIQTGLTPLLTSSDDFSVSLWINTTSGVRGEPFGSIAETGSSDASLLIMTNQVSGKAGLFLRGDGGSSSILSSGSTTINDGNWHHLVFVKDSTANKFYLYVDTNLDVDAADSGISGDLDFSGNEFYIGAFYNRGIGSGNEFAGLIDEVSVFNVALSADNITYLYNGGSPGSAQQYPFSAAGPSLSLVSPNGGESFSAGSSESVTWSDSGSVVNVRLEYSTDNGSSYSDIVASTGNTGSYSWTVPNENSSLCLVRVSEVGDAGNSDVSDAVFSISAPADQSTAGGRLVFSWLIPLTGFFSVGDGVKEFSNRMILDWVRSPHLQITDKFVARVEKVVDGDTVTLSTSFRDFTFPLRLANIDALEMNAGGQGAKDYLTKRVLGKEVLVYINPRNRVGKYGRLIGELFVNGFNVGEDMMRRLIVAPFGFNLHRVEPFTKIITRAGYGWV